MFRQLTSGRFGNATHAPLPLYSHAHAAHNPGVRLPWQYMKRKDFDGYRSTVSALNLGNQTS